MPKNVIDLCLDTSPVIEVLYGTEKGQRIQKLAAGRPVKITVFTIHELLAGMKKAEIETFLKTISVIDFTKEGALHSSMIERHLREKGNLVNKMDILIAGICLKESCHLITCDHDFEMIKGIQKTII